MSMDGIDQRELMRLFAEFMETRKSGPKVTFRDLWIKYQAYGTSKTDGGRTRIKSWDENQRGHAAKLLFHFGDLAWEDCNLAKAEEYRQWRASVPKVNGHGTAPAKASSRNRELRSAAACLSYARKQGTIPRNPMEKLTDEPELHQRDFSLLPDQTMRIMQQAVPKLRFFLLILNETGMRRGELLKLEWSEVDLDGGFINLPAEKCKAKRKRQVPLSTTAMCVLEMMESDGHNPYVFANPHAPSGHVHPRTLWRWFKEARERAGVTGPKGQAVWMHTYRHTFATDMATSGLDIETLMNICGWTDHKIVMKYINIAQRHRQAAKANIDARGAAASAAVMGLLGRTPARRAPAPKVAAEGTITTTPEDTMAPVAKKAVG